MNNYETVQADQIWRNTHGAHVIIGHPGIHAVDGCDHDVLWVQPCTDQGVPFGSPIPMNPPDPATGGGFPGDLWTPVGHINNDGVAVFEVTS